MDMHSAATVFPMCHFDPNVHHRNCEGIKSDAELQQEAIQLFEEADTCEWNTPACLSFTLNL